MSLFQKISDKTAKICVMGLGQVGLPVALSFCKAGFFVSGYDINENHINLLKNQQSPFKEYELQELLKKFINENKFLPTSESSIISESDIIIVCVPTPISDEIKPDLSLLKEACKTISKFKLNDKLIVIESSIPPKTFEVFILPIISENKRNNFFASYVPERLSPGQAFEEIHTTSRVIGAFDEESRNITKTLYKNIIKAEIFLTNPILAETCKLVENTYRDVNVAFANEIAMICERYNIDVLELRNICNSHPRVNLLLPGPGVGGPCLPKDPYLLLNPYGAEQIKSDFIVNARKINDSMPNHVFDLIKNALKEKCKKMNQSVIAVLGSAYKSNVSDTRFSPTEKIVNLLLESKCIVKINDPHTEINFGGKYFKNIMDAIKSSDLLVILTDHNEYKSLTLDFIREQMNKDPILVDTKRIFDGKEAKDKGFVYLSIGCNYGQQID